MKDFIVELFSHWKKQNLITRFMLLIWSIFVVVVSLFVVSICGLLLAGGLYQLYLQIMMYPVFTGVLISIVFALFLIAYFGVKI
jgi:hypothetical protein